MKPVHFLLKIILILSSHLRQSLPSVSSFQVFQLSRLFHACYVRHVHLILLDPVILTLFGEQFKLLSPPLCNSLQPFVIYSRLGTNYINILALIFITCKPQCRLHCNHVCSAALISTAYRSTKCHALNTDVLTYRKH